MVSFITATVNGDVVCSCLYKQTGSEWRTHWTYCLYYEIIVVADAVLNYFLEYCTVRLSLRSICMNPTYWYTWRL